MIKSCLLALLSPKFDAYFHNQAYIQLNLHLKAYWKKGANLFLKIKQIKPKI